MLTRGTAPDAPLIDHREHVPITLDDWRAESIGRMLRDAQRAVRRWPPPGMNRLDRDALAQDAVCVILAWDGTSGDPREDGEADRYVIQCGAEGMAPTRELWRSSDEWRDPSNNAWILLHRAITQALRAPRRLGWRPDRRIDAEGNVIPGETPTDPVELDTLRERSGAAELAPSLAQLGADHAAREDAEAGVYPPIPDDVSVKALAEAGEIPLRAARALAYQSMKMTREDAAREWGMTLASVDVAVSNGARWIRDTYPETRELAAMLRRTSSVIRGDRLERATDAVYHYLYALPGEITDGAGNDIPRDTLRAEAERAVMEWRESSRTAPAAIVALEVATRRAYRRERHRLEYVEDGAEIARAIRRAVDDAKRAQYRRLASPVVMPLYGAPIVPAPCPVPTSPIVARWMRVPLRARAETDTERAARAVRFTAPGELYFGRELHTETTRRPAPDTSDYRAEAIAYWTARVEVYARHAPGSSGHALAKDALAIARRFA